MEEEEKKNSINYLYGSIWIYLFNPSIVHWYSLTFSNELLMNNFYHPAFLFSIFKINWETQLK